LLLVTIGCCWKLVSVPKYMLVWVDVD
jgi:hypothetical protein